MVLLFFGDSVKPEAYVRIKLGETTEDGDGTVLILTFTPHCTDSLELLFNISKKFDLDTDFITEKIRKPS